MTIIYLHGVKVRDPQHGITLGRPFMRWLGPKVARNSVPAAYTPVYWGDIAARFRWNLASRPRTLLLKQGGGGVLENIGSLRTSRSAAHASVVQPAAKGPLLDGAALAPDLPVPPLSAVSLSRAAIFLPISTWQRRRTAPKAMLLSKSHARRRWPTRRRPSRRDGTRSLRPRLRTQRECRC